MNSMGNFYQELGISPVTHYHAIKSHIDLLSNLYDEDSEEQKRILWIGEKLMNPYVRRAYDNSIGIPPYDAYIYEDPYTSEEPYLSSLVVISKKSGIEVSKHISFSILSLLGKLLRTILSWIVAPIVYVYRNIVTILLFGKVRYFYNFVIFGIFMSFLNVLFNLVHSDLTWHETSLIMWVIMDWTIDRDIPMSLIDLKLHDTEFERKRIDTVISSGVFILLCGYFSNKFNYGFGFFVMWPEIIIFCFALAEVLWNSKYERSQKYKSFTWKSWF